MRQKQFEGQTWWYSQVSLILSDKKAIYESVL